MSTRRSEREFFISSRLVPQLVFYLEKANLPYYRVSNYCVLVHVSALSRLGDVLLEAGAFMFVKSERT
ncbi:MAG: hypothetical protein NZM05_12720, partial [Chloroherpetonaceae bacterium]|nr:hypothetical protein [Chloroherpetonaceae bacterium]